MRRLFVVLGIVLVLGAAATMSYRWLAEPARYSRYQPNGSGWRGLSEPRSSWRDSRSGDSSRRSGDRQQGMSGLRLFEIVVDLLNVVVGIAGIWLAVAGVRMQRAANRRLSLRSDV